MRNRKANLNKIIIIIIIIMVLSDLTGSERAFQEMDFKILKYGKHI